jgi:serine/threonine protein kinase
MGPPAAISRDEFVKRLSESGLLSGAEMSAACAGLGGHAGDSSAGELAQGLVDAGRLTTFQAAAILERRSCPLLIGNYAIESRLGSGGMGTVFNVRHRRMNRVVALKVLSRGTAGRSDWAQRFQREVETVAQLSHPNIVMAYDAGETEDGLYLVMECVDGRDLAVEIAERGPLSVADATNCIIQAARGLACAHSHGIFHRDVKPANLLRDHAGLVGVADLGLAHLCNSEASPGSASLTLAGNILDTADYMAPEQVLDSATVDRRVDIYSPGCTLFFLLGGRPLYSAGSLMALLLKHRDAPTPPLHQARADVPAELDRIYRRMTAKRAEDRFATMDEVVDALERLQGSVALSAVRPVLGDRSPVRPSPLDVTMLSDPNVPTESGDLRLSLSRSAVGAEPTASDVRRMSDLNVVLVEPSRFQARIVHRLLLELRIENVLGVSGQQALELAKREGASVVVSSMYLGDMTGLELAQALRDDPGCSGIGFVLASSDSGSVAASETQDAPLVVLLQKPYDLRRLAQSLAQATGRVVLETPG